MNKINQLEDYFTNMRHLMLRYTDGFFNSSVCIHDKLWWYIFDHTQLLVSDATSSTLIIPEHGLPRAIQVHGWRKS